MVSKDELPPRYPLSGVDVLVVGGGVGGLWAALELWRKGHNVRVIESRSEFNAHGDVMSIGPSAISTIHHWPWMSERLKEISIYAQVEMRNLPGELITGPFAIAYDNEKSLALTKGIRPPPIIIRPQLNEMMAEQLAHVGVEVEYGRRVVDYYETDGRGGVRLKDGSTIEADLVVAADGVHTASWGLIKGENKTVGSGYSILRSGFDPKPVLENAKVKKFLDDEKIQLPVFQFWLGPHINGHFILSKEICSWGLTHRDDGTATESWSDPVPASRAMEIMREVEGWHDIWSELANVTPENGLIDFKLFFRSPNPQWMSPKARVIQLGDSAHSFIPSSGNGATQAMEDGLSLAACLQIAGKAKITEAVRVHTKLRFERVTCIQKMGFINRDIMHRIDWDKAKDNPELVRPRQGEWIYLHLPEQYAIDNYSRVLEHLATGAPFENTNIPPGHKFKLWTAESLLEESNTTGIKLDGQWFDGDVIRAAD